MTHGEVESTAAWVRLAVTLALSTIGGVGMWSVVVALPTVQTEFGVARGAASLPYTLTMLCFGAAGIVSLAAFIGLILVPAISSYGRIWEKAAAGILSLIVLCALVLTGVVAGLLFVYYYDAISELFS